MNDIVYSVEDEENIRELITATLQSAGFKVETFDSADKLYKKLKIKIPSLITIDIMLPDTSGIDILKFLKKNELYKDIPIIFLTAKFNELDKVKCLDLGADDYIVKPFGVLELISRVKAVIRRYKNVSFNFEDKVLYKDLVIDNNLKSIFINEKKIKLTFKEYELFMYLYKNRGIILSRERILDVVWDNEFGIGTRTVDVHIRTLRSKIFDNIDNPKYILTSRGHGYMLLKE